MTALTDIKGIGEKNLQHLQKLGVTDIYGLIDFLPRGYLDFGKELSYGELRDGEYSLIKATVLSVSTIIKKGALKFFKAKISLSGRNIWLVWFNQPYLRDKLSQGDDFLFWGKVSFSGGSPEMVNPSFEKADDVKKLSGVMPIYRTKNLIPQVTLNKIIKDALSRAVQESIVPDDIAYRFGLGTLAAAYGCIHSPKSVSAAISSEYRIAIEDCVRKLSAFRLAKRVSEGNRTNVYADLTGYRKVITPQREISFTAPFELTHSQNLAFEQIKADLLSRNVMNRLLLGDVGSGKTVIAFKSMFFAVANGYQCVMMAPTEILARQHYENSKKYLKGMNTAFLSGSTKKAEKQAIAASLEDGTLDVLFCTHAVLGDSFGFKNLSLVVIDELHRFGVGQKARLQNKAAGADVLVMTATPIPRSLRLVEYGDLDISEIQKRAMQKDLVSTHIVSDKKLEGMFAFIKERIAEGEKAYIVCPVIEDQEGVELMSAKGIFKMLQPYFGENCALLHGGMNAGQKEQVMQKFYERSKICTDSSIIGLSVLISTSVIEVGIDVPDGTVMAVLDAERFGLAALHQLRGRVGRGDKKSYCFLHTKNADAVPRLELLKKAASGFEVAEADLELRGCGDFLGLSQSGDPIKNKFCFAKESSVIAKSKEIVDGFAEDYLTSLAGVPAVAQLLENMKNVILN